MTIVPIHALVRRQDECQSGVIVALGPGGATADVRIDQGRTLLGVPLVGRPPVGALVAVGYLDGDLQSYVAVALGARDTRQRARVLVTVHGLWAMFRAALTRAARSTARAAAVGTSPTSVVVNANPTEYLRASEATTLQFGAQIWPVRPDNQALCDPDEVVAAQAVFDEEVNRWYILLGTQLVAYDLSVTPATLHTAQQAGGNFGGAKMEPLLVPASVGAASRKLWVVDSSNLARWTWRQVDKADLTTVRGEAATDWLNWTGIDPLPHTVDEQGNRVASPIYFYDSPYSRAMSVHASVPLHQSLVTSLSNVQKGTWSAATTYSRTDVVLHGGVSYQSTIDQNRGNQPDTSALYWQQIPPGATIGSYVTPAPDPDFLGAVEGIAYDANSGNWGRQMARSQLLCLDLRDAPDGTARVVWGSDGRSVGSNPTVWYSESYTPLLIADGRLVLHYEGAEFRTDMQPFRWLKVQIDVSDAFALLPTTHWQSFRERIWNEQIPAPPWAWKSDRIRVDIASLLREYVPEFHEQEYRRDYQSKTYHGIMVRDANSGVLICDTQRQSDFQPLGSTEIPPREVTARQYVDTGAADGSRHLMFSPSTSPIVMTGTSQAATGETNIRKILGLREGQYCVMWLAVEEFEGDYWGAYDYRFLQAYYDDTGLPLGDPVIIDGMQGDPEFPDWAYAEANRRAEQAWRERYDPESGWTLAQWMGFLFRYRVVPGYHSVGLRNIYYQGRARYCVDAGADGLVWDEQGMSFLNYTDPIGRWSHRTRSVQYWAWCVQARSAQCVMLPFDHGWDWANCVSDGERVFFLPRIAIRPDGPVDQDESSQWKPIRNNVPPPPRRTDLHSANPEPWPAPPEWSSSGGYTQAGDLKPTLLCRNVGDMGIRWQRQWTREELPLTHPPAAATWRGYLYVVMAGKLWKFSAVTGQTLATVDLPADAAQWTRADLIVTTGQLNVGGDGGLIAVPLIAVTGPDGQPYTAADIADLPQAIAANADVAANTAARHERVHSVLSHLGLPAETPQVDSALVAAAGGGWQLVSVADVLATTTPTIDEGTC